MDAQCVEEAVNIKKQNDASVTQFYLENLRWDQPVRIKVSILTSISFSLLLFQGTSTKYSPQRVGISHVLDDEDVIQIMKK